jgi:hypothetical protein
VYFPIEPVFRQIWQDPKKESKRGKTVLEREDITDVDKQKILEDYEAKTKVAAFDDAAKESR